MFLIMAWGKEFLNSILDDTLKQIFVSSLVAVIGYCFHEYVFRKIMFIVRFNANLNDLEKATERLRTLAKKIERSPTPEVEKWHRDVEEFVAEANSVRAAATDDNERFCGWGTRIRLGSKVGRLLKVVETLLKAGNLVNDLPKPVENIPGPSIENQTTASRNLAELTKMLKDNSVQRIGVWGMGGVGKTTLVRNLNNELYSTPSEKLPFTFVIWITVSKVVDMERLRQKIAERLDLPERSSAGRLHQRLEQEKFLLILDDVWNDIDLDELGIPQPNIHNGSKILLTSRSKNVFPQMGVKAEVRVDPLNHEEAWQLFSQKVEEVTSLNHIEPIARKVAKECGGLPLALVIVATALRGKEVHEWETALKQLQRSAPSSINGVEDKVYNCLRWSYDSLPRNNIKSCFLYCALYPEDFSIEDDELLQCWLAEGFIDVKDGFSVIKTLKNACLLEDGSRVGTVKMHDVVRDVARWIASPTDENDSRSLVGSGIALTEIEEVDFSEDSVNRVSSTYCCVEKRCSKVSTLLLQGNSIEKVPDMFLQRFPELKVMNVSRTGIKSLPPLLRLGELRAFLLQRCSNLQGLPPLGVLIRLQVLNLSGTRIEELPKDMENLINLRQVNLSHTYCLRRIQAGIVSKWTRLEVLDMTFSSCVWYIKARKARASFEELLALKDLSCVSLVLGDSSCLNPDYLRTRIGSMKRFHFTYKWKLVSVYTSRRHEKGRVTLNWSRGETWNPERRMGWLLINATSLFWNGAKDPLDDSIHDDLNNIIECLLSVRSVGTSVDCFAALKSLTINNIRGYGSSPVGGNNVLDFLPNLEELSLESITSMQSISELVDALGLKLEKLKTLLVFRCPDMKYLFTGENFPLQMPNLKLITVSSCDKLEMLFHYKLVLRNLRILKLQGLTELKDLCIRGDQPWSCPEKVYVFQCSGLTRLPLDFRNAGKIPEIRGESQWWSKLEWDDEETKSRLPQHSPAQGRSGQYREGFELEDGYSFFRSCYTPENLENTA